jgi:hypothetical protein
MAGEYRIKVNVPERPDDDLIEVYPFGLIENGKSFTAILNKRDVERYGNNPHVTLTTTKRKKSDMSEGDLIAWETAEAEEAEYEAEAAALQAVEDATPVAGEGEGNPMPEPQPENEGSDA